MMAPATRRRAEQPKPDPSSTSTFGDFLRDVMETRGCTSVAELVRLIGVDQSSVSRYLSGQSEPTLDNLRKIASALNANLGELMVVANIATREELGMVATPQQRWAPVLRDAQAFCDHPDTTRAAKQFLLKAYRGLLDISTEARDGVAHEATAAERRR